MFSTIAFEFAYAQSDFEDTLCDLTGGDWTRIGWDDYDNSLEIYECANDMTLSDEALNFILVTSGFSQVWCNHKDGYETHYSKNYKDGTIHKGEKHISAKRREMIKGNFPIPVFHGKKLDPDIDLPNNELRVLDLAGNLIGLVKIES